MTRVVISCVISLALIFVYFTEFLKVLLSKLDIKHQQKSRDLKKEKDLKTIFILL